MFRPIGCFMWANCCGEEGVVGSTRSVSGSLLQKGCGFELNCSSSTKTTGSPDLGSFCRYFSTLLSFLKERLFFSVLKCGMRVWWAAPVCLPCALACWCSSSTWALRWRRRELPGLRLKLGGRVCSLRGEQRASRLIWPQWRRMRTTSWLSWRTWRSRCTHAPHRSWMKTWGCSF